MRNRFTGDVQRKANLADGGPTMAHNWAYISMQRAIQFEFAYYRSSNSLAHLPSLCKFRRASETQNTIHSKQDTVFKHLFNIGAHRANIKAALGRCLVLSLHLSATTVNERNTGHLIWQIRVIIRGSHFFVNMLWQSDRDQPHIWFISYLLNTGRTSY